MLFCSHTVWEAQYCTFSKNGIWLIFRNVRITILWKVFIRLSPFQASHVILKWVVFKGTTMWKSTTQCHAHQTIPPNIYISDISRIKSMQTAKQKYRVCFFRYCTSNGRECLNRLSEWSWIWLKVWIHFHCQFHFLNFQCIV